MGQAKEALEIEFAFRCGVVLAQDADEALVEKRPAEDSAGRGWLDADRYVGLPAIKHGDSIVTIGEIPDVDKPRFIDTVDVEGSNS
ncbi:hypothetical protein GCM10011491_46200 [Brucella endophytica]|uniref:Uncharacterized protein n=1 Tax=Brucella endophytica TaxID=1963359 RepID=A0A916STS1_9HYPH|nr:hypothetical protein GCM10011491_46200 [Brucella endophytica]